MPRARTEKPPDAGMSSARFDARNRNSACFLYSAEYTGSQQAASVGYLTLVFTAAARETWPTLKRFHFASKHQAPQSDVPRNDPTP